MLSSRQLHSLESLVAQSCLLVLVEDHAESAPLRAFGKFCSALARCRDVISRAQLVVFVVVCLTEHDLVVASASRELSTSLLLSPSPSLSLCTTSSSSDSDESKSSPSLSLCSSPAAAMSKAKCKKEKYSFTRTATVTFPERHPVGPIETE